MITIPDRLTKTIVQNNRSKILGNIWSSFNLDLQSQLGMFKLSPRLRVNTANVANQGLSVAFRNFDSLIFTIAGTKVFKNSATNSLTSAFTQDASTGTPTLNPDYSDMEVFNLALCATTTTKLVSKAEDASGTGAWTERATLSTATSLHKLQYFQRFNRLYYIDIYKTIKSIDTSWSEATSGDYFIDLTYNSGVPYTMAADSNDIWIGTVMQNNTSLLSLFRGGAVLRWDGISSTITNEYRIKAQGVLALCTDDRGVMHAIDTEGALLQFNGDGFSEIGRLPFKKLPVNSTTGLYNSFIHPNGFVYTKRGTFILNVNNLNGDSSSSIEENLPSGIWEWSKETGFVHRQSVTYNALANSTVTDYGQNRVSQAGALYEPNIYNTDGGKPSLICGMNYYTDASTVVSGIFVDDPLDTVQKNGYFVTSWIQSFALKDTWKKIGVKFREFLDASDKIVLKYRIKEEAPVYIDITWVNTTQFSTVTDLTNYVGYEVEVIQGTGSGKCAHISSLTGSSPWKANLDETFTGVSTGTAKARLQNWKKITSIGSQNIESNLVSLGVSSERIQLKTCMQFTGEDELHEFIIINNEHELLK